MQASNKKGILILREEYIDRWVEYFFGEVKVTYLIRIVDTGFIFFFLLK